MLSNIKKRVKTGARHIIASSLRNERIRDVVESVLDERHGCRFLEENGHVRGYVDAERTISEAGLKGMTVSEYLEDIWGQKGTTDAVVEKMREFGVLSGRCERICEIGPGAGMYLEKVLQAVDPSSYEIYEPAGGWRDWLAGEYGVVPRSCDGHSLSETESASLDLIQAHGVFVYVPFLTTASYFREIARVVRAGGYAVFDVMCEECFDSETVDRWLESEDTYPTFLPREYVLSFFKGKGFQCVGEFINHFGAGKSRYFVFKRQQGTGSATAAPE